MTYDSTVRLLGKFHDAQVLVLGDVMLDRFIYGSIERISPEAPIPVIAVERIVDMPGGAGNVARNCASMGARVVLISVVGDDDAAEDLRSQFALTPTIQPSLIIDPSRPTVLKSRYVAGRQQVLRADTESRAPLSPEVAERVLVEFQKALTEADVVVLSDYAKGVLSEQVTQAVISAARNAGKTILVDPKSKSLAKYRGATVLTPNRHELQLACGHECVTNDEIVAGARGFLDEGICDTMVVTRGADGMSAIAKHGSVAHLRTSAKDVFDVSGAGDTVLATLALGLAARGEIVDVCGLANVAAGIVVGKHGTATVTVGEIVAALNQYAMVGEHSKILSRDAAVQLAQAWRGQGLKIAFTNGCFDLLHPGHVSLLSQARQAGDRLIVGLNADLSVRRLKGPGRPVQSEIARAVVLASLKSVDAVVIFSEDTPLDLIRSLEPDVLVKGSDYTRDKVVGADVVMERGGKVLLVDLVAGHSTTDTVRRVASTGGS
jgi:D-beta-D-heptose 7-phosphate kinase / D-beta-D-heptose 1-phosphate adenosyltransferase